MPIQTIEEFKKILSSKFGKYKTTSKGDFRVACPTCNLSDSKKCKRYVNPNFAYSNCFICQESILISELLNSEVALEFSTVAIEENVEHPSARVLPFKEAIPVDQLDDNHEASRFLASDFLNDRTMIWDRFRAVYIPNQCGDKIPFEDDKYVDTSNSLLFPVMFKNELVGWQCRFLPSTRTKIKYFHLFNKGRYLYNYDEAKKAPYVVLMEGIKKSWKFPGGAVASLGKNLTETQVQLLQEWRHIILFLDGEDKTQEYATDLQNKLFANSRFCINIDPRQYGAKSPDEMTTGQVTQIIEDTFNLVA